ncbi:MAG TPA: diguanylate cyclase [Steroidobacteraceae bacterium]
MFTPTARLGSLVWGALAALAVLCAQAEELGPHPAQALIDRAAAAVRTDPEASDRDARAALELLKAQPDVDLEIRARLLICDHLSERDRAGAEEQSRLARKLLPGATRRGLEAGVLVCEGTIVETAGDNALAAELYDQAVLVAEAAGDEEMLAGALFSRAYLKGLKGQYAASLTDLKRAHQIYERIDLPHHAVTALNGIAILYNRMGDHAQARHLYGNALAMQRQAGMRREQGVTLHNIGRVHENLGEWELARQAFQESYELMRELKYARGEAYALRGLAAVANATGDPRKALETLERADALQRRTPDVRLAAQIALARGTALRLLDRLEESVASLEEAVGVFEQADSLRELEDAYKELAAVHTQMGNWRAGYDYLAKAHRTTERLFRNQIDQRFASLKVEFDTATKEKENALLLRENQANQKALAEGRLARRLQAAVIVLTVVLALLLATLAIHQWHNTRRMRRLAMTDELTGVPNRRAVLSRLEPLLAQPGGSCAMLIIDIDHFKSINDEHGHPEGDEALKQVADCLRSEVREPSFIGRLGGEEFVVVMPDADEKAAAQLAETFRQRVSTLDARRWFEDRHITVSIGITLSRRSGDTPSTTLQRADAALYEAKRAGRNCARLLLPAEAPGRTAAADASCPGAGIEYA